MQRAMVHRSPSLLSSTPPSSSFPSYCSTTGSDWPSSAVPFSTPRSFSIFDRNSGHPKLKLRVSLKQQVLIAENGFADFMRFINRGSDSKSYGGGADTSSELQTSVVSYRKKYPWSLLPPFLQVDLVSTIHIADKEYFATLRKKLESYDCVLYEMVADRDSFQSRRNPSANKKLKSSITWGFDILGFFMRRMASLLMLHYQLDCLEYRADNWYHADLDAETFDLLQRKNGESFFTFARDVTLRSMKAMMQSAPAPGDFGTWVSKQLQVMMKLVSIPEGLGPSELSGELPTSLREIIGSFYGDVGSQISEYPELELLFRLDFAGAVKVIIAKELATTGWTDLATDEEDKTIIIGERNRAATEALRRAIKEGHKRIAIIYGAGHMPDLSRRLRNEFDLVPSEMQWIAAWSIRNRNLAGDSLTPSWKTMPKVWNGTPALLMFGGLLAMELWFYSFCFGITIDWISRAAFWCWGLIH